MSVETPLDRTRSARDVSVTERGQFRTCRRRWFLETIENWTPKQPAWALEFGTGVHEALEAYYEGFPFASSSDAVEACVDLLEAWYDKIQEQQKDLLGPLFTEEAADELWDLYQLGRTMLTNYVEFDQEQQEKDPWTVVAIEGRGLTAEDLGGEPPYPNAVPFIDQGRILVPIVDPNGEVVTKDGDPAYLSARIDLLVRRGRRQDLWVVDHKTTSSTPNDRGLDFEDQVTGYSYAIWRLTGKIPRGTIFNYLVKQAPKEPRMTQKGLSTAKDQLCLARDYRQALIDEGLMVKGSVTSERHAECYDALLSKGWDPYFKRLEPTRNLDEVLSFEWRLFQEYQDMTAVADDPDKAYPNPSMYGSCSWCPMGPVCQAMEDGSDVDGIIEARYMQAPDRKAQR